jgi:hypothetical protein
VPAKPAAHPPQPPPKAQSSQHLLDKAKAKPAAAADTNPAATKEKVAAAVATRPGTRRMSFADMVAEAKAKAASRDSNDMEVEEP